MTPEQWQEVKELLAGALERTPRERAAYLDQICAEPALRREVESLITSHEHGETTFLEHPPVADNEVLKGGVKLGPYEIVAWLGAGGMGVVYRARDGRLERDVAIKDLSTGSAAWMRPAGGGFARKRWLSRSSTMRISLRCTTSENREALTIS